MKNKEDFEAWWADQDNGCPQLVANNDEEFARAVWNAATESVSVSKPHPIHADFDRMETSLQVIAVWAGCDSTSPDTRRKAMADIRNRAMNGLGK